MGCGASADNDNILGRESRSRATSYVPSSMLHEGSVAAAGCAASCSPAASSLGGDSTATKSTDGEQLRRAKAAASRMIDTPEEATTRKALKVAEPEPRLFSPHSVSLAAAIVIVVTDDETKAESSNRGSIAAASEGNPLSPPRRAPLTADSLKELQRVLEEQDHAPR